MYCLFSCVLVCAAPSFVYVFCLKLIYLKVTALLFPTSDFRHPVTTPALLFIGQALTKVRRTLYVF